MQVSLRFDFTQGEIPQRDNTSLSHGVNRLHRLKDGGASLNLPKFVAFFPGK